VASGQLTDPSVYASGKRSRSLRIPTERRSKINVRLDFQPNEVRLLVIAIASNIIKQHRRHN